VAGDLASGARPPITLVGVEHVQGRDEMGLLPTLEATFCGGLREVVTPHQLHKSGIADVLGHEALELVQLL